jgi:hypothetical protein
MNLGCAVQVVGFQAFSSLRDALGELIRSIPCPQDAIHELLPLVQVLLTAPSVRILSCNTCMHMMNLSTCGFKQENMQNARGESSADSSDNQQLTQGCEDRHAPRSGASKQQMHLIVTCSWCWCSRCAAVPEVAHPGLSEESGRRHVAVVTVVRVKAAELRRRCQVCLLRR